MRVTLLYNLRRRDIPEEAEFLTETQVEDLCQAIARCGHDVTPVEASGPLEGTVDALLDSRPELVFNTAEGTEGEAREATFPAILEIIGLPYTGSPPTPLLVDLNKRLTARLLAGRGVRVPAGALITGDHSEPLEDMQPPFIVKPNSEGSSKGITQDSVVEDLEEARTRAAELLEQYPDGVVVEEMISGRELVVPLLEAWPGSLLEPVEHTFPDDRHAIYDYELKRTDDAGDVETVCPIELDEETRSRVEEVARGAFAAMPCRDLGRVDLRLPPEGDPVLIEVNPLPALGRDASFMISARASGLDYERAIELIMRSASRRWGLSLKSTPWVVTSARSDRPTVRELGIELGTYPSGPLNAITDVEGVRVGHVTQVEDDVEVPESDGEKSSVRTGITAVVPCGDDLFHHHLVAGGFILNGIGEMSGLTQLLQWGWLETPILLTNTMSVGQVHAGIIRHMLRRHPELGRKIDVVIPVVAETNDGFLNDVRIPANTPDRAIEAIQSAADGPVEQGSVGAGTGLISFDFAGGIGTSSRRLPDSKGGHTVGVLVQANFGKMRNLTVDGMVVGRELDTRFPMEGRRGRQYGSVIVVVATDAPLLSSQLDSISTRAALGLGRVGSFGRSTSGEIVCAFSTGNRVSRADKAARHHLDLVFVNDELVNPLYEATVEATEEAVLNALFCSAGQTGREGRSAPPLPVEAVLDLLDRGHDIPLRVVR